MKTRNIRNAKCALLAFIPPTNKIHVRCVGNIVMNRIECKKCRLACHRICYNPTLVDSEFLCDVCLDGISLSKSRTQKKCVLCNNAGLLKNVGDNLYGHPICLIRHPSVNLACARLMKFHTSGLAPQPIANKKCGICHNPCQEYEKC